MAQEQNSDLSFIDEQAFLWAVRAAEPGFTPEQQCALRVWLSRSLAHELAFARADAAWSMLDRARALRPAGSEVDADVFGASGVAQPWTPRRRPVAQIGWAAAAAAAVVISVSVYTTLFAGEAYATGLGERRVVVLRDHTRVELNSNSKIVVTLAAGRRQVQLVRGEAVFEVARAARPLLISSSFAQVQAFEGAAELRVDEAAPSLLVLNGDFRLVDEASSPRRVPAATQAILTSSSHREQTLSNNQITQVMAWRRDGIDLTGLTLGKAAAEFNRYNSRRIIIADPNIRGIRLGGYFGTRDLDGFVRSLSSTLPVRSGVDDRGDVVLTGI